MFSETPAGTDATVVIFSVTFCFVTVVLLDGTIISAVLINSVVPSVITVVLV